jgi:hypothetical protein
MLAVKDGFSIGYGWLFERNRPISVACDGLVPNTMSLQFAPIENMHEFGAIVYGTVM